VVLIVVGALVLLSIPLYFLRAPEDQNNPIKEEAPLGFAPSVPAGVQQETKDERFTTEEPVKVKCSSSEAVVGKTGSLCDDLPFFEDALLGAIRETIDCAPRTGEKGTLNYVMKIDFSTKQLHVFPGASGMWKGPQARRAAQCVKRALPAPNWDELSHNFRYYEMAVLTHYAPPAAVEAPLFE
jgi:hypothetical protein